MNLKDLPQWLAEAQALQTIEGNPFTDEELQYMIVWDEEGLTPAQMRQRFFSEHLSAPAVTAAE